MPVTTISGENKETEINRDALYLVDFSKIESVESLVLIFACMGLSFSGHHPHFDTIKHLLDLENAVIPNNPIPQQPKADALRLPKLKKVQ
jgi:hypothetical protein